jgi:hypothetical protein
MVERPTDIKRLIDFMLGQAPAASRMDPERIGFFGFSGGGFTGKRMQDGRFHDLRVGDAGGELRKDA